MPGIKTFKYGSAKMWTTFGHMQGNHHSACSWYILQGVCPVPKLNSLISTNLPCTENHCHNCYSALLHGQSPPRSWGKRKRERREVATVTCPDRIFIPWGPPHSSLPDLGWHYSNLFKNKQLHRVTCWNFFLALNKFTGTKYPRRLWIKLGLAQSGNQLYNTSRCWNTRWKSPVVKKGGNIGNTLFVHTTFRFFLKLLLP